MFSLSPSKSEHAHSCLHLIPFIVNRNISTLYSIILYLNDQTEHHLKDVQLAYVYPVLLWDNDLGYQMLCNNRLSIGCGLHHVVDKQVTSALNICTQTTYILYHVVYKQGISTQNMRLCLEKQYHKLNDFLQGHMVLMRSDGTQPYVI